MDLTHLGSEVLDSGAFPPADKLCWRTSLIRGGAAREGGWTNPADGPHSFRGAGRGGDILLGDERTRHPGVSAGVPSMLVRGT